MRYWLAIVVLGLLAACQQPELTAGDPIAADPILQRFVRQFGEGYEDTMAAAEQVGVDYRVVVAGAFGRDPEALHQLFWLTVHADLDAASAEGHEEVLATVLRQIGDADFGEALALEPPDVQDAVREYLLHDLDPEDTDSDDALDNAHYLYPHTFPAEEEQRPPTPRA